MLESYICLNLIYVISVYFPCPSLKFITSTIFTYLALEQSNQDAVRSVTTDEGKCTVGGNHKCNPATWDEFGGYRDGCCTPEQLCGVNEGDCSTDNDCHPGLMCGSKNCPKGVGFGDRADCCEPISGVFKPGKQMYILPISTCM